MRFGNNTLDLYNLLNRTNSYKQFLKTLFSCLLAQWKQIKYVLPNNKLLAFLDLFLKKNIKLQLYYFIILNGKFLFIQK